MAVRLLIAFSSTYCCGIKAGKRVCWYGAGWCILNAHTEKKNAGNPKRASCLTLISSLKPKSIYIAITPTAVLHNTSLFSLCNQIHNQSCPNQHLTKIGETKTGEEVSRGKKKQAQEKLQTWKNAHATITPQMKRTERPWEATETRNVWKRKGKKTGQLSEWL